jgi:putative mRNA 3-end processing factor
VLFNNVDERGLLMPDVVFTAYSNFNPSRYEFRFGTFRVAVDFGAGFDEEVSKQLSGQPMPDAIIITHGHRDHIGMVPQAMQRWRKVPVYATFETVCLGEWIWNDELNVAMREGRRLPFCIEDVDRAVRRIRRFTVGTPVELTDELTVTPFHAGHILGAVGLVFTYRGDNFVVTGDISMHSHGFIGGAVLPKLRTCRTLVRESTYAGVRQLRSRDDIKRDFLNATESVLQQRGKVVIPALSIDRLPEVYVMLHEAGIDSRWPVMVAGGSWPAEVYADYAPGAQVVRTMPRFENRKHASDVMWSNTPIVVLATSGMMAPGTPSYEWGTWALRDSKSAIFMVNWQNPTQPGGIILNAGPGQELQLPGRTYKKLCRVERFDFSSHAKENEMGELEESLNPDFIVHVHGEPERIAAFIKETDNGGGPLRVQPQPWQEVVL